MSASRPLVLPAARQRNFDSPWLAAACIILAQLILALVVSPHRDFPLDDDWTYAQVVQSVLQGQLHLSEIAGPSTVFHAYWGALWCSLFGFSFSVLTIANMVMGTLGSLILYGLLREVGVSAQPALIGALTFLLNPITVFLSYTFQTDLTFLTMLLAALWAFAAAWQRPHPHTLLLVGGLCNAAAVLTRQIGMIAPLIMALLWTYQHGVRRSVVAVAATLGLPVAAYGLFTLWMNSHGGPPWAMSLYSPGTILRQMGTPDYLVQQLFRLIYAGGFLAFLLLPMFALFIARPARAAPSAEAEASPTAAAPSSRRGLSIVTGLGVLALYVGFYVLAHPFNAIADILRVGGYLPNLVGTDEKAPPLPPQLWDALTLVVAPLAAGLVWAIGSSGWRGVQRPWQQHDPRLRLIGLTLGGVGALTFTDRFFHDTLLLPLLPGLILLLLKRAPRPAGLLPAAIMLLAVAGMSVVLLRDYWGWHTAAWRAGQALVTAGVPPAHINGGGEWGYWYAWEQAVQEARAAGQPINEDIHTHLLTPDYVLSFSPHPAWIPDAGNTAQSYRVCTTTPYTGLFDSRPSYIYTLTRGQCPTP